MLDAAGQALRSAVEAARADQEATTCDQSPCGEPLGFQCFSMELWVKYPYVILICYKTQVLNTLYGSASVFSPDVVNNNIKYLYVILILWCFYRGI